MTNHPPPTFSVDPRAYSRWRGWLLVTFPLVWLVVLVIGITGGGAFDGPAITLATLTITAFFGYGAVLGFLILSGRYERNIQKRVANLPARLAVWTCVAGVMTVILGASAVSANGPVVAGLIIVFGGIGTVGMARTWWRVRREWRDDSTDNGGSEALPGPS